MRRPGYETDIEEALHARPLYGMAPIPGGDLDWRWLQAALDFGCMLSINPDAHLKYALGRRDGW
jgi:DNA polymerase (family 10)